MGCFLQALYSSQIGFIAVDGACVGERCTKLDGVDMELKYLFYSANSTFKPPVVRRPRAPNVGPFARTRNRRRGEACSWHETGLHPATR